MRALHAPLAPLLLLPAAFLIHDLEELVVVKSWMQAHGSSVPAVIRANVPTDHSTLLTAFAILFAVYMLSALAVVRWPTSRAAIIFMAVLIMARFTNGIAHAAQGFVFAGYTPGLITALVIEIPVAVWAVRRMMDGGLIKRAELIPYFVAGWAVQIVGIAAVVALSTAVAG